MAGLYNNPVFVSSPDKLPKEEHWAIIYSTSTDDGYGGRSAAIEYRAFLNRQDWEDEIQELTLKPHHSGFRAMHVKPAVITVKATVEVK